MTRPVKRARPDQFFFCILTSGYVLKFLEVGSKASEKFMQVRKGPEVQMGPRFRANSITTRDHTSSQIHCMHLGGLNQVF